MTKKVKHSLFLITINSNQALSGYPEKERRFKAVTRKLVSPSEIRKELRHTFTGEPIPEEDIIQIRLKSYGYEVGQEKSRSHIHAVVEVEHTSMIKLDQKEMREILKFAFGEGKALHLDIKATGNMQKQMEDYAMKSQSSTFREETLR